MEISVIICTYNPRPAFFWRVLEALRAQTLPMARWELLVVDNASPDPVDRWDLSWHPQARHISEPEKGTALARLRGIRESSGELLVFCDDDNVLAADYLAEAWSIARQRPSLGAFGAGISEGEFETTPPETIVPYLGGLALCRLDRDQWSNSPDIYLPSFPFGAGLCFRRVVGDDYAEKVATDPLRRLLGRHAGRLTPGEDTDLALCATDRGMDTGRFLALKLVHLMPKERLTETYFVGLYAGFAAAGEILHAVRTRRLSMVDQERLRHLRHLREVWKRKGFERRKFVAEARARKEARSLLRKADPTLE